ncbi:hypothetical protein JCGZ_08131 [Jatropha curcas]|uniref:Uncharacterized protein n=1 Tax=Jatropha curcas TaxID=180498 RepID=A0A067KX44_JATCU|nr:hypothetical protein JCGZ_08131 [Jatropha curcas]
MINPKKVIEIASKWQNAASLKRRRRSSRGICLPTNHTGSSENKCKVQVAQKGHFVVYSIDKKRFVVPLYYLNHSIFKELFKMSEEEFGLPGTGPIVLPCDAVSMEYVISLVKQHFTDQESYIRSMVDCGCSFTPNNLGSQQIPIPGF